MVVGCLTLIWTWLDTGCYMGTMVLCTMNSSNKDTIAGCLHIVVCRHVDLDLKLETYMCAFEAAMILCANVFVSVII